MSKISIVGRETSPKLRNGLLAMLMLASAVMFAGPVQAQTETLTSNSGVPRADVVKLLGERYAEVPVSMGLAQNGGIVEIFTTADGATWTIVLTMPNGKSRVIGSGESWTRVIQLAGRNV